MRRRDEGPMGRGVRNQELSVYTGNTLLNLTFNIFITTLVTVKTTKIFLVTDVYGNIQFQEDKNTTGLCKLELQPFWGEQKEVWPDY